MRFFGILTVTLLCLICGKSDAQQADESVRPLSVPPLSEYVYPADRPKWIEDRPELEGQVHRWPVCSAPSGSAESAHEDMLNQARAVVKAYVNEIMPDKADMITGELEMPELWLQENLIDENKHYLGKVTLSDGEWYEEAVELGFMPEFREQLIERFHETVVTEKMRRLAGLGVLAFVSLATVSTVLRISSRKKQTA